MTAVLATKGTFQIRFARGAFRNSSPELASDDLIHLTNLINQAYRVGEDGIFVDTHEHPFLRATEKEVGDWIEQEKLLVVVDNNDNNSTSNKTTSHEHNSFVSSRGSTSDSTILGCIKFNVMTRKQSETNVIHDTDVVVPYGEWGCLAVQMEYQGLGLGRFLIETVEKYLFEVKHCRWVQLDLVAPTDWKQAHKERLRSWYTAALQYELLVPQNYEASTIRFPAGQVFPGGALTLATDTSITTYRKYNPNNNPTITDNGN